MTAVKQIIERNGLLSAIVFSGRQYRSSFSFVINNETFHVYMDQDIRYQGSILLFRGVGMEAVNLESNVCKIVSGYMPIGISQDSIAQQVREWISENRNVLSSFGINIGSLFYKHMPKSHLVCSMNYDNFIGNCGAFLIKNVNYNLLGYNFDQLSRIIAHCLDRISSILSKNMILLTDRYGGLFSNIITQEIFSKTFEAIDFSTPTKNSNSGNAIFSATLSRHPLSIDNSVTEYWYDGD